MLHVSQQAIMSGYSAANELGQVEEFWEVRTDSPLAVSWALDIVLRA